jgi:hypothetical protein
VSSIAPQSWARLGGFAYLVIIAFGIFGEAGVRGRLLVPGDAAATAANVAGSELLWRLGIAADLIAQVCDVAVMLTFYLLLRPVNRNLALAALLLNLVQTAVLVTNKLALIVPLILLGNEEALKGFAPEQLQALSYLSIRLHSYGFGLGLIFFGTECLIVGYLIRRSAYLPRILGVGMQIAGACYLTNTFALLLAPDLARAISPAILVPVFFAELALCLWLIAKGVDVAKWNERAALAA